jgi:hypothetical protein
MRVSAADRCLLFPESDLVTAWQRNDAKAQQQTLHRSNASLFDYLVSAGKHSRGNGDAQSFRSLQVENHQVSRRLLDWQVSWVGAFENFVNVKRSTSIQIV